MLNDLLFVAIPYATLVLAVVGTIVRFRTRPFSVSSLSSQLLENRKLFWGSVPFHWGVVLILLVHLLGLLVPSSIALWNAEPIRLYILEISGLALAAWTLFGLLVLIWRRVATARIRAVTRPMDLVILGILLVQIVSGIGIALMHRWGSFWGPPVLGTYLRGILTLQPQPELVASLPWMIKLHVMSFFAFAAVFPFSRLVHLITVPLGYFVRPYQLVRGVAPRPAPATAAAPHDEPVSPAHVPSRAAVWARAVGIVVFFTFATVWLPSYVLRHAWLAPLPDLARDLIGAGLWTVMLVAGLWALRWAQRSARI